MIGEQDLVDMYFSLWVLDYTSSLYCTVVQFEGGSPSTLTSSIGVSNESDGS